MKLPYTIELDEYLEDSIDSVVSEVEEAAHNIRNHYPKNVRADVEVDLDVLLVQNKLIAHLWRIDDVQQLRPDLTEDQAWDVLASAEKSLDASLGITWDTLRQAAEHLYPERDLPPDPEGKNDDRAAWALHAIKAFQDVTGADIEDALGDLVCDLMHWADRQDYDFELALCRARDHYAEETKGE